MNLISVLAVAVGGALGAVMRYLISLVPFKSDFPFATIIANLAGAVIIGFIAGFAAGRNTNKNIVLFFKTGMCGGFTTFSTFSLESLTLLENGKWLLGSVYILTSVLGCLLGVWCGLKFGKLIADK